MAKLRQLSLLACAALGGAFLLGCQQDVDQEALLLKQLASPKADQRWSAALAIRDSAPVPGIFVPALVKALDDEDPRVRIAAAQALGEAGSNAREQMSALVKLANEHSDVQVRAALSDAVIKINSPP